LNIISFLYCYYYDFTFSHFFPVIPNQHTHTYIVKKKFASLYIIYYIYVFYIYMEFDVHIKKNSIHVKCFLYIYIYIYIWMHTHVHVIYTHRCFSLTYVLNFLSLLLLLLVFGCTGVWTQSCAFIRQAPVSHTHLSHFCFICILTTVLHAWPCVDPDPPIYASCIAGVMACVTTTTYYLRRVSINFLPKVAPNHDPPYLCLLSS
jgi:hypothetical protein